jgi:hypothetical protein
MPTDKMAITWMCPACGEFGVLLRQPTVLFTDVMAAVAKDHKEVAAACKSDVMISSEEALAPLPAISGLKPPRTLIETILSHWQLPAALLVLVLLANADRVVVQMSAVTGDSCRPRKSPPVARCQPGCSLGSTRCLPARPVACVRQDGRS